MTISAKKPTRKAATVRQIVAKAPKAPRTISVARPITNATEADCGYTLVVVVEFVEGDKIISGLINGDTVITHCKTEIACEAYLHELACDRIAADAQERDLAVEAVAYQIEQLVEEVAAAQRVEPNSVCYCGVVHAGPGTECPACRAYWAAEAYALAVLDGLIDPAVDPPPTLPANPNMNAPMDAELADQRSTYDESRSCTCGAVVAGDGCENRACVNFPPSFATPSALDIRLAALRPLRDLAYEAGQLCAALRNKQQWHVFKGRDHAEMFDRIERIIARAHTREQRRRAALRALETTPLYPDRLPLEYRPYLHMTADGVTWSGAGRCYPSFIDAEIARDEFLSA